MKLYFLVAVDVDRDAVVQDNPPEDIGEAVASELRMSLDDFGVRGALGITGSLVEPVYHVGEDTKIDGYDRARATALVNQLRDGTVLLALAARFLHYSWSPINYAYSGLTRREQGLVTRGQFKHLKAYLKTQPAPKGIEPGPGK
jgi:hypothetical protein